jgi:hypothetical protein
MNKSLTLSYFMSVHWQKWTSEQKEKNKIEFQHSLPLQVCLGLFIHMDGSLYCIDRTTVIDRLWKWPEWPYVRY